MAPLYAAAVRSEPALFVTALDALWDLRRRDHRPPNRDSNHPARLVRDNLTNLARMPNLAIADRVIDRVTVWLTEPDLPDDAATPLFALKSLLEKEGNRFEAQTRWNWALRPYSINPSAVGDLRTRIRALLHAVALGDDLRRVGATIKLLTNALRQPHGYGGQKPDEATLDAWEADDLATIATLKRIAERTTEPLVRRHIRAAVAWPSDYAASVQVQHAALDLVTTLDNIDTVDEDLAEVILHPEAAVVSASRRGIPTPTLEDLITARGATAAPQTDLDEAEKSTERKKDLYDRIEDRKTEASDRVQSVAARLLELDDNTILDKLAHVLDTAHTLKTGSHLELWPINNAFADLAPNRIGPLVELIAAREPSRLDPHIDTLISGWLTHDLDAALTWLEGMSEMRTDVRRTIGYGFDRYRWHNASPRLEAIYATGLQDPEDVVRNQFLRSSGAYLAQDPEHAPGHLLAAGITPDDATHALQTASRHEGLKWGATFDQPAAEAVLALITHTGYSRGDWVIKRITAGIATNHPIFVLEHLAAFDRPPISEDDSEEIAAAYENHATALATWVQDALTADRNITPAIAVALGNGIQLNQAEAFTNLLPDLDRDTLPRLVLTLDTADAWAAQRPSLTVAIYERARELGILDDLRPLLQDAMTLTGWTGINGASEDLNATRAQAQAAVESTTDLDALADFQAAHSRLSAAIEADRTRFEEDRENDF